MRTDQLVRTTGTTLAVGSLCTGFDGLGAGLEQAGWPVHRSWFAETDPDAMAVLTGHWPTVPNLGDITTIDWGTVPPVDVVAVGWPCQPNSVAGKRRGRTDERNLWPDVARAIEALRPGWFLGENVPGLLTVERGQAFGEVTADLDRLGYVITWALVGACVVGTCHHRHRLFLMAHRSDRPTDRPTVILSPYSRMVGGNR